MILPTNEQCAEVISALEMEPNLTDWETSFVESNYGRTTFSDKQKVAINTLLEKYEISLKRSGI